MSSPTILVVGGAGFVGSHTCKALSQAGYRPVVYDNLSTGSRSAVKWGPLELGDLGDPSRLADVFDRHRPVGVMHFAALTEAGRSVEQPGAFYRVNFSGTLCLLDAMASRGVTVLVFSSTAAVYGEPTVLPIPESHALAPLSPYGRSKLFAEHLIGDVSRSGPLRHCVLRYFNAAGADPEAELQEAHDPETHLIPLVLQAAAGLRPSVSIYGTDYDTADGTCVRDYVHVSDLATAHVRALKRLMAGGPDLTLNLGTGCGFSVLEVIRTAEDVLGESIAVVRAPRRAGDPAALIADPRLARRALDWTPRYPTLRDQIQHAASAILAHSRPTGRDSRGAVGSGGE